MQALRTENLATTRRIFRNLKGTPEQSILYTCHGHLNVEAYKDVDGTGSKTTRRSTTG